ncbi:monovalent cation/H(+) antiporter subunit G [Clostridiaceae bacterium HSG29]|nr:monovalent cation/H(+) antiporter subunit G [Clostridiaceae bacterium HSG29]
MIIISNIMLVVSWIFIILGLIGISRFDKLYSRLLTSSKIDSAAISLILVALMLREGFTEMTSVLIIILMFVLFTSPITNHLIAFSAYRKGITVEEESDD